MDFHFDRLLQPWLVQDAKESVCVASTCKGGVALQQKFAQRIFRATGETCIADVAFIHELCRPHANASIDEVSFVLMFIFELRETIRQSVSDGPELGAEPIRKPFGDKIDSGFATVANVGPDIEELMRRDRFENKLTPFTTDSRTQAIHRERDKADVSLALAQIEREGDVRLENCRINFVMNECGPQPVTEE